MSAGAQAEFSLKTTALEQLVDVTPQVNQGLAELGLEEGAVLIYCPHTTAAVAVNESADPDVSTDITTALAALVPRISFQHAEGNSPAHLRSALLGPSVVLPVSQGRLKLGTWQGVYFCEFDGPRARKLWLFPLASPRPSA